MNENSIKKNEFFRVMENKLGKDVFRKTNKMFVSGIICTDVIYSHSYQDVRYYEGTLKVQRISGIDDFIKFSISEDVLTSVDFAFPTGKFVKMAGYCRSYNSVVEGNRHLELKLVVKHIEICEKEDECINMVYLMGTLCRDAIIRKTPYGKIITELFLAVNNSRWVTYFVPCIVWNESAESVAKLKKGDKIRICGNFQSRTYQKLISEEKGLYKERMVNEISVFYINRSNFD